MQLVGAVCGDLPSIKQCQRLNFLSAGRQTVVSRSSMIAIFGFVIEITNQIDCEGEEGEKTQRKN